MEKRKNNTGVHNSTKSSIPTSANRAEKHTSPLFEVGFVKNRETYVDELNQLLVGTGKTVTAAEISEIVKSKGFDNRNVHGYARESDGSPIEPAKVMYRVINTGLKNSVGKEIVGWFAKGSKGFCGISWGTESDFIVSAANGKKFNIGDLHFDDWNRGLTFLDGIAKDTIPETWGYQHSRSAMKHPILKSYIENILNRLTQEGKLVFSQNGKWMMFNTNLLDKFFHEVIIVAEVRTVAGKAMFFNPQHSKSVGDRLKKGFRREDVASVPKFFDNVNEVIYQIKWTVDRNFEKFAHIIEERIKRFPAEYRDKQPEELARKLDSSIEYAISITQRNYKFVVPMYRPQTNSIQLLMPIYLGGTFQQCPDFALVLTPDAENEIYTPETILPLDAAYQNARLVNFPFLGLIFSELS